MRLSCSVSPSRQPLQVKLSAQSLPQQNLWTTWAPEKVSPRAEEYQHRVAN